MSSTRQNFALISIILFTLTCLNAQEFYSCTKVLKGNIIQLAKGEKIRLIGVDTPEFSQPAKSTQYYTRESVLFTKKLVEGKRVRLEYDEQKKDGSGRTLAYVLTENGVSVNAEIIKQGYGFVNEKDSFKFMNQFKEYERIAKGKQVGLWKGGGEFELTWLIKQKRRPIKIYSMANGLWGLEYDRYIKPRIKTEDLVNEIENIEKWSEGNSKRDLFNRLIENGWVRK